MQTSTTITPRSFRGLTLLLGFAALGLIQPRAQADILIDSTTNNGSFETTEGTGGFAAGVAPRQTIRWLADRGSDIPLRPTLRRNLILLHRRGYLDG